RRATTSIAHDDLDPADVLERMRISQAELADVDEQRAALSLYVRAQEERVDALKTQLDAEIHEADIRKLLEDDAARLKQSEKVGRLLFELRPELDTLEKQRREHTARGRTLDVELADEKPWPLGVPALEAVGEMVRAGASTPRTKRAEAFEREARQREQQEASQLERVVARLISDGGMLAEQTIRNEIAPRLRDEAMRRVQEGL